MSWLGSVSVSVSDSISVWLPDSLSVCLCLSLSFSLSLSLIYLQHLHWRWAWRQHSPELPPFRPLSIRLAGGCWLLWVLSLLPLSALSCSVSLYTGAGAHTHWRKRRRDTDWDACELVVVDDITWHDIFHIPYHIYDIIWVVLLFAAVVSYIFVYDVECFSRRIIIV